MGRSIVLAVPSLIVFAFLTGAPGAIGQATKTDKERLVGRAGRPSRSQQAAVVRRSPLAQIPTVQ
jgi:hypothetical protein